MAIDAKMDFLRQAEKALADSVTVSDMGKIMTALGDVLEGYEMTAVRREDDGKDDLLECYLSALRVQCRSEKTLHRYEYIIRRMMNYVQVPTRRILVYHLRNYLAAEKARGVQDSTLEGYREIFSAYFNWLQRESLIERNPAANLGTIKCAKKEKKVYTRADIEKLTQECRTVRDRAIIHFLASTGCRISEMTGLNRDQVDMDRQECVVHGKGNKDRKVYMNEVAVMFLSWYLNGRTDDNPALFVGKCGERLTPGGVRTMLKGLQAKTGVDHVHPHKFRRTLATEMAKHGMQIQEVANILGHEKLDTTMKYVIHDDEKTKSDYRRYA